METSSFRTRRSAAGGSFPPASRSGRSSGTRAGKNHLLAGRFLRQDHHVELSVRELINRSHIRASWNNPIVMKTYYRALIGRRVGAPVDQPRISGFGTVSGEVHRLALVRHDRPARH